MGCQASVILGKSATLTINCHDPDTAEASDADEAPIYRVYEGTTATPLLTGTMSLLDDANTTGFYAATIACTTANGFEVYGSYNVYVEAVVDTKKGTHSFGFTIEATLSSSSASATSAASGDTLTIPRGDTFIAVITDLGDISAYDKLWFTVKTSQAHADTASIIQIDLTGLLYINGAVAGTLGNGSITIDDDADGDITIILKAVETAGLTTKRNLHYDVQGYDNATGVVATLTAGELDISADTTRVTS